MSFRVCPNLVSHGACTTEGCRFQHDVHLCQTCRVVCTSAQSLRSHQDGKKHARRARAQSGLQKDAGLHPSFCKLCNVFLGSSGNYSQHIQGKAHRARLEEQQHVQDSPDPDIESDARLAPRGQSHCHVCDVAIPERFWSSHVTGFSHRKKEGFASIQAAFDEADKDKHGIVVSSQSGGEGVLDFGFIELNSLQSRPTRSIQMTLHLTTPGTVRVSEIRLFSTKAARPRPSKYVNMKTDQVGH
jgi:helicase MOV-10